jgi:hypothetical protein
LFRSALEFFALNGGAPKVRAMQIIAELALRNNLPADAIVRA